MSPRTDLSCLYVSMCRNPIANSISISSSKILVADYYSFLGGGTAPENLYIYLYCEWSVPKTIAKRAGIGEEYEPAR